MSEIRTDKVCLKVADGTEMGAYVARPEGGGPFPGLMVFQEAFGVNGHIRNVAERFAREGYVAIAPELFHRTGPGFEGSYGDFTSIRPHMQAMTPEGLAADVQVTCAWLRDQSDVPRDRLASIGFCMGGRVSYVANTLEPLRASISFYGGGIGPELLEKAGSLHAPMLFFWGGLDKHIPPEQHRAVVDALTGAGKDYVNVEFSNADHGFFCDERPSFQPEAARQAWTLSLEFLRLHLG